VMSRGTSTPFMRGGGEAIRYCFRKLEQVQSSSGSLVRSVTAMHSQTTLPWALAPTYLYIRRVLRPRTLLLPLSLNNFSPMSQTPSATSEDPNFQSIFNDAVKAYNEKTKGTITEDPLLAELGPCTSANDILIVLHRRDRDLSASGSGSESLTKWLTPTINVLYAFSATIGGGVGLVSINILFVRNQCSNLSFQVFPPANVIFTGIGVLLSVCTFLFPLGYAVVTSRSFRRPRMSTPAEKLSPISLLA
jgi:hypothetical protein